MPSAFHVALYLIRLAADEAEPIYLTHLHLQKLLYYVQGWSLALRHVPAFGENIEAWTHGPVVRAVYPKFADFGKRPIVDFDTSAADCLTPTERFTVAAVWEQYKGASAICLRNQTHKERPWIVARGGIPAGEQSNSVITAESLREFFSDEIKGGNPAPLAAKANWDHPEMDSTFIEVAQATFIRNSELLKRLAS